MRQPTAAAAAHTRSSSLHTRSAAYAEQHKRGILAMAVHGQPAQQARMRLSVKRCEAPATHAGPASGLHAGELLEHLAAETAVVGVG